jgi:hypothetical protein
VRAELARELVQGDRHETDRAAGRLGDLLDRLGEGQQPGSGQLVELAHVPVFRQCCGRDVGDVIGVEERLCHAPDGERDLAVQHLVQEEPLVEVLAEPRRPQDGPVGAGISHRLLAEQGPFLAPS